MKKLICLLAIATMVMSCNKTTNENDGYVINGTAQDVYNGMRVYLKSYDERGTEIYQDTAVVVDEKFVFEGKVEQPELWFMAVNGVDGFIPVMVENDNMSITINKNEIAKSKISGSKSNDVLRKYNEGFELLREKQTKLNTTFREIAASADMDQKTKYSTQRVAIDKEMSDYHFNFVKKENDNVFSLKLVESILNSDAHDVSKVEETFNSLDESIKNSKYGRIVRDKIKAKIEENKQKATVEIGGIAPDFSAANPEGKNIALNDIKGKVTIIDFWASWCGPCRRENPNVVKVYNKFHDKGLEIISVSLDKPGDKDKWIKAIEDDNLTWHHVSNLNYFNDPIAQLYQIQAIPATFILDGDGKIVAKKLRGQELEDKIAELLN